MARKRDRKEMKLDAVQLVDRNIVSASDKDGTTLAVVYVAATRRQGDISLRMTAVARPLTSLINIRFPRRTDEASSF